MNIDEEYKKLKELVLKKIPDTYTINNSLIEERPYNADFLYNINPYFRYKTYCEYTPRTYVGDPPVYRMTSGEETTVCMWDGMLQYKEYDLLADLFILGFFHDCLIEEEKPWSEHSIAGCYYNIKTMKMIIEKAKKILEDNNYGHHDPRCKTYLTIYDSNTYDNCYYAARGNKLQINNTKEFVEIMMKIITESYDLKYFIINVPSDHDGSRDEENNIW